MITQRRLLRSVLPAVAAVALSVLGVVLVVGSMISDQAAPSPAHHFGPAAMPATSGPTPTPTAPHSTAPTPAASSRRPSAQPTAAAPAALPDSKPRRIRIPAADISAKFVPLDLLPNGELSTPNGPDDVGWFAAGRTPGGPGVAVVAAHVTWNGAPGAFFRLGSLHRGDRVAVERKDGTTAVFAVQSMDTFPKDKFPTDKVYRSTVDPELVLITCGGDFDANRHYYNSNVIVWAKLVGQHRT